MKSFGSSIRVYLGPPGLYLLGYSVVGLVVGEQCSGLVQKYNHSTSQFSLVIPVKLPAQPLR